MEKIEVAKFFNPADFLLDIDEYVASRHFGYFLFIKAVDRLWKKEEEIFDALVIKKDKQIEIIYMLTNHGQYIFGEHSCEESISSLISIVDLGLAKKNGLFGSKQIIDKLIQRSGHSFEITRHREYFSCSKPKSPLILSKGFLHTANVVDLEEISVLALEFYQEEFHGKGFQTEAEVINGIIIGINRNLIFCWKMDNQIISYLQIIDNRNNKFMIGSVFTKQKFRGKGYGKTFVFKLMKRIQIDHNIEFGFMVSSDNQPSIKMFSAIGFIKVFETGIYEYLK